MRIRLPKFLRKLLLIGFSIGFVAFCGLVMMEFLYPGTQEVKTSLYKYDVESRVAYKVATLPNPLYSGEFLPEGKTYLAKYTSGIYTTFQYRFKGEGEAEFQGDYSIIATMKATHDDDKLNVWERDFVIQPLTAIEHKGKEYILKKEANLNYPAFAEFLDNVTTETQFQPEKVELLVKWNVNLQAHTDKGLITETSTPSIVIPLKKNVFSIAGNPVDNKSSAIETTDVLPAPPNMSKVTWFGGLSGFSLVLLFLTIFLTENKEELNYLQKAAKGIFKHYGDRMVAVHHGLGKAGEQVIPVRSMKDLVLIADELGKPIMYEHQGAQEDTRTFYLLDKSKAFVFEVTPLTIEEPSLKGFSSRGRGKADQTTAE